MLSKNTRNMILKTTVALTVGLTSVVAVSYREPVMVEAATVINQVQGVVTVKVSSIWTYSTADWTARSKTYNQGTKFNVLQKLAVSGKEMYRLDNGLYISANPTYVSFQAAAGTVVTTPPVTTVATVKTGKTTVNLNMRSGAGTGNAIVLTIPKGGTVTINSASGGWSNVTYSGKTGWVSSQYITGITSVTAPAPTAPAPATPAPIAPSTAGTSKTTVNLNMRSGASAGNAIILTIPKGGTVTVISTSGGWSKVSYNGKTGWVSAQYLTAVTAPAPVVPVPTTPAPAPVAPSTLGTSKTTVNLNMRSGASAGNAIILTIPKGGTVTVISTSGGWSKVSYNGKTGWVSAQYLTAVTAPAPVVPVPTTPAPAPVAPSTLGTSKTTVNLNMRSGASAGNAIILTIPKGGTVTVHSTSNGWSNVTYNGKKGWVSAQYLTAVTAAAPVAPAPITPAPTAPAAPVVIGKSSTTENLNMRSGAGTGNAIISTIPKGGLVSIYSTSNGWSNVSYNGKTGWVSSQFLTTMVPVAPPVVVTPPVVVAPPVVVVPTPEVPVVVVKPAVLLIDEPKTTFNNENVSIFGRAVTKDGVTSVTATINGKTINVERYERAELNTLYSDGYKLEQLGFRFTIDKTTLAAGSHTLVVTATAKDGTVKKVTSTIKMIKPAPVMTINGITDGQAVPASSVTVSGFAVNIDGVTGMKYYVNGVDKGAVNYGTASTDTGSFSTYTGYKNANYSFTLNGTDFYSKGMNSLRVEMMGKDGTLYARTYVLRGSETGRYMVEEQTKTRDEYAILETKKSVWPKISHGGFVNATMNEIQYHLDPGNFIYDEANKYMFMDLRYDEELNVTAAQLDNMLSGKGVLHDMGEAFLLAGQTYNVNPIYLASHAILETGHGTSTLAKGQKVTATYAKFGDESTIIPNSIPEADKDKLVYNVFGIGAWDINANLWGAQKAYELKWFSVEEAIMGGAQWIGQNYINRSSSQNTLFKMRFNFPENMGHEYATDLGWAQKQSRRIKDQIEVYMLKNPDAKLDLKFYYPKFK